MDHFDRINRIKSDKIKAIRTPGEEVLKIL